MICSIVIATFGSPEWASLAESRALPSAKRQGRYEVILHHDPNATLAQARNYAVESASGEWIVICDGDDMLEDGYVDAMLCGSAGLRFPRIRYIQTPPLLPPPMNWPVIPLFRGNYMVIGSMFRRDQFLRVGGFSELPAWEDWHLWCRLVIAGASVEHIPGAIYRVYVKPGGRNQVSDPMPLFNKIVSELRPLAEAAGVDLDH